MPEQDQPRRRPTRIGSARRRRGGRRVDRAAATGPARARRSGWGRALGAGAGAGDGTGGRGTRADGPDAGSRAPAPSTSGRRARGSSSTPAAAPASPAFGQPGRLLVHDPVERAHQVVADLVRRAGRRARGTAWRPATTRRWRPWPAGRRRPRARGRPGEPVTRPVWVSEASASARAMPKSESFTWPSGGDQDVRRLHVAVHDPGRVRGGQRVGGLAQQRGRLVGGERAVAADQLGEGRARRRTP